MDQLVEGVLAVRPGLAPLDRSRLVVDGPAVERDVPAVRLHRELLEVGGEALQLLVVRQNRDRLRAKEFAVPGGEEAHQHREVAREGRRPEMLIHGVEAREHAVEVLRTDGDHRREADRRVNRE